MKKLLLTLTAVVLIAGVAGGMLLMLQKQK